MVFDTAVNMGVSRAKTFYANCNNNPNTYLKLRKDKYAEFIRLKPSQKKYEKGWSNRLNQLKEYTGTVSGTSIPDEHVPPTTILYGKVSYDDNKNTELSTYAPEYSNELIDTEINSFVEFYEDTNSNIEKFCDNKGNVVYANDLFKNIPYSTLEKLNPEERVLYHGKIKDLTSAEAVPYLKPAIKMYSGYHSNPIFTKDELNTRVLSGEFIYCYL